VDSRLSTTRWIIGVLFADTDEVLIPEGFIVSVRCMIDEHADGSVRNGVCRKCGDYSSVSAMEMEGTADGSLLILRSISEAFFGTL
jgi:hypothetical protein